MVKTAGDALQHGALTACVFAGDRQNSDGKMLGIMKQTTQKDVQKMAKNSSWLEVDQLAIYKDLNSGQLQVNIDGHV